MSQPSCAAKILVVEDEPEMLTGIRDNCEYEGLIVLEARTGEEGIRIALEESPDLVLLDVMLPKLNGFEVCRTLRRRGFAAPIVMLTARGQEIDKVMGLESGADDYVTKPFGVNELLARIRAQLRRNARDYSGPDTCDVGPTRIDFRRHQAVRDGQPLEMTPREFAILKYFANNRGRVVTRDELLDRVWGYHSYPFTRTVDNHIARLRQKLEPKPDDPHYFLTVHGVGYKFVG